MHIITNKWIIMKTLTKYSRHMLYYMILSGILKKGDANI